MNQFNNEPIQQWTNSLKGFINPRELTWVPKTKLVLFQRSIPNIPIQRYYAKILFFLMYIKRDRRSDRDSAQLRNTKPL